MSDPQALHAELLAKIDEPIAGDNYFGKANEYRDALRSVLELHKPQDTYPSGGPTGRLLCFGCELDGYDAEHPEYPCETVEVISSALGVTTDG